MTEVTGEIKLIPRPFEENAYKYADEQAELYRGLKEPNGGYANIVDAYIAGATKENAELKETNKKLLESCQGATMMYEDLCKAKGIIKELLDFDFLPEIAIKKQAEQFLKEADK